MRKSFKQQKEESQIQWKSMSNDPVFNPNKLTKYYAVIKVGDKSYVTEYEAKTRSEARVIFEEESRLSHGTLEVIGVFK